VQSEIAESCPKPGVTWPEDCPGGWCPVAPVGLSAMGAEPCLRGEVSPGLGVEGQHWSAAVFGVADESAAVLRVVAGFDAVAAA